MGLNSLFEIFVQYLTYTKCRLIWYFHQSKIFRSFHFPLPIEFFQFATLCRFNALNSNPSRTSYNKDWQSVQLQNSNWFNRFRHLYDFFELGDVSEAHCGSILQGQKTGKLVNKFPKSRVQTAGDRNIRIEPKIAVRPPDTFSYSDMWSLILFKYLEKYRWAKELEWNYLLSQNEHKMQVDSIKAGI